MSSILVSTAIGVLVESADPLPAKSRGESVERKTDSVGDGEGGVVHLQPEREVENGTRVY